MARHPLTPVGDILVLAGDIAAFCITDKRKDFFDYVSAHFPVTYWIPGNHEYYDADISDRSGKLHEQVRSNVFLVNNSTFVHGHARFIFSTLWSAISIGDKRQVENYISDFKSIRYRGGPFSVEIFNQLHQTALDFVSTELNTAWQGKTVVVTHHVPTLLHYPNKYKGDKLNQVFAVELRELVEKTQPDYWIYGHHHSNTPAFNIGSTQMLCNQLGYVHHYEYGSFVSDKHIVL